MSKINLKRKNWLRKKVRTKNSLGVLGKYPRLVVFKSNKHIYGQLVDDNKHATILSSSTMDKDLVKDLKSAKTKIDQSKIIGESLAKKIKSTKIKKIVYDRNGYKYHGRVRAVADSLRDNGVNF